MTISSKEYGDLYEGSDVGRGREPGPFVKVFITGQPRPGQTPGTMSSIYSQKWDEEGEDKYLIHDENEVYFLPMFIKRVREKWEDQGEKRRSLTWFSFNPDKDPRDVPDGAKYVYLLAGALLDENMKPVKDKLEPERTAFVFFKCAGSKFGGAMNYVDALHKKGESLEPLSDDKSFEKEIVLPRRFICKAMVEVGEENSYGNTPYLFKFEIGNKIPDKSVKELMEKCLKWWEPFKKQFDMEPYIDDNTGSRNEISSSEREDMSFDSVGEDDGEITSQDSSTSEIPEEELDLGI